eukprot:m.179098 g.179098  ORF g.179098 m.179098 type:complete len:453 (+) comp17404_c0_seq8:921-2279(+)
MNTSAKIILLKKGLGEARCMQPRGESETCSNSRSTRKRDVIFVVCIYIVTENALQKSASRVFREGKAILHRQESEKIHGSSSSKNSALVAGLCRQQLPLYCLQRAENVVPEVLAAQNLGITLPILFRVVYQNLIVALHVANSYNKDIWPAIVEDLHKHGVLPFVVWMSVRVINGVITVVVDVFQDAAAVKGVANKAVLVVVRVVVKVRPVLARVKHVHEALMLNLGEHVRRGEILRLEGDERRVWPQDCIRADLPALLHKQAELAVQLCSRVCVGNAPALKAVELKRLLSALQFEVQTENLLPIEGADVVLLGFHSFMHNNSRFAGGAPLCLDERLLLADERATSMDLHRVRRFGKGRFAAKLLQVANDTAQTRKARLERTLQHGHVRLQRNAMLLGNVPRAVERHDAASIGGMHACRVVHVWDQGVTAHGRGLDAVLQPHLRRWWVGFTHG